jgi:hypothetical protein
MNLGLVKVLAGYLTASAAALIASVKVACVLGGDMIVTFSGNFFR